jgi:hypothetical protein
LGKGLRGKRLKLALALKGFSETETPNVKQALLNTAEAFVDLEEYRKYMHDRIGSKATEPIKLYKVICKNLRVRLFREICRLSHEL